MIIIVGRSSSYSDGEDTALARCWTTASQEVDEQNAVTFWDKVVELFQTQPEQIIYRSADRLRCR